MLSIESRTLSYFAAACAIILTPLITGVSPAFAEERGILSIGDAVITGFSGVVQPEPQDPPLTRKQIIDETFIDPQGISARVNYLASPAFLWDARVWNPVTPLQFTASAVGQVFGVALDDAAKPNIYLAASSAYGLHIVKPDADNDLRPERLKAGEKDAGWMEAQWGAGDPAGGPGSIWKVDGETGKLTLFANVMLDGQPNAGAALGNLAYDRGHKQLFVSDLSTGMIHRLAMDGSELEVFDPGVSGLQQGGETPVAYDASARLDITNSAFDAEDASTWGYADAGRSVWALTVHGGRLYYAMTGRNQIWSVGLEEKTGKTLADARWELDVPTKPKKLPVTDMLFTSQGAMILAQRGEMESPYDYSSFAEKGKARMMRYWLENPDDVNTPSRWIADPEEYSVGFGPNNRATDGGLALGHGYTKQGFIDSAVCEASIWTTGDDLRDSNEYADALTPGGALVLDGLQGMPTGPVRQDPPEKNNTPPWTSYMVDVSTAGVNPLNDAGEERIWSDTTTLGWMGDLAILRGCDGDAVAGGGGGSGGGGYYGWPTSWPYDVTDISGGGDGGGGCTGSGCAPCVIGSTCPPPPPPPVACATQKGKFICDPATGTWNYVGAVSAGGLASADTVAVSGVYAGHTVPGAPLMSYGGAGIPIEIKGGVPGQTVGADLCFFNAADKASGKPFACCKIAIDEQAPLGACVKKN